jgi:hypothetical protein
MNPGRTPGRVLRHQLEDQILNSFESLFLSTRRLTLKTRLQYLRKPARCQRSHGLRPKG